LTAHALRYGLSRKKEEKMFKKAIVLSALSATVLLAGCAPAEFVNPDPQKLVLGKSTKEDVFNVLGNDPKPIEVDATLAQNGQKVHFIEYKHLKGANFWGLIVKRHSHIYVTHNNILVADGYDSCYDEDSTEFDVDKVPQIKNGMTKQQVIALMGKPSGEAIYPMARKKGDNAMLYRYTHARFAGIATTTEVEELTVSLDSNNLVDDVVFKDDRNLGVM
jgi:hypothetical protein